jgi:tetratricopeptide (TPR) repeat protein
MLVGLSDSQFTSYRQQAMAWAAFAAGRLEDAQTAARDAVETTSYFGPMVLPVGARAAIWDGDAQAARGFLDQVIADRSRGAALSADIVTIRAGVAALEGRPAEALVSYREALRAWQGLGLVWDEALCAIDMATVLDPADSAVRAAVDGARAVLARLGAKPMLERLESAASRPRNSTAETDYRSAASSVR